MSNIDLAHAHIRQLIAGVEFKSTRDSSPDRVNCLVTHPKREINTTSFVRAAKKQGLNVGATPSASNRNEYIVAYITMADKSAELLVKGTNDGPIYIDVTFKSPR